MRRAVLCCPYWLNPPPARRRRAALQAGWRWAPAQLIQPGAARVPAQGCADGP